MIGSDSTVSPNTPHGSPGHGPSYIVLFLLDPYSFTLLHAGWAWRLAVLSGAAAPVPLVAVTLRWPALGSVTTDWLVSVGVRSGQRWDGAPL